MRFLATISVPGYLPMDDDPPVFDTSGEAWDYLADERVREEEAAYNPGDDEDFSDTIAELAGSVGVGTLYGATPGYDGDHDLGLAYSVSVAVEE